MPDINTWLGGTPALATWRDDVDRAYDTERTITAKSASITITRAGVAQAAQTVRLEPQSGGSDARGQNATVSNAGVLIVGYKDHPTITDTDIRRGDRFFYAGQMYTVTQAMPDVPNRLLATAEASE